ncbi:alpha/beta hydrolase [Mycetocola sp. 2940]|uniref:alpha/beta fold hydrolase n=1 Tax=Mycetocola sp. 2940 TaxID=3156452 RepID=UPI0033944593
MTKQDKQAGPTTEYLSLTEGRVAYDVQGSGPLVLMVPGMGDLRATYRFLAPAVVASGHSVVTMDLRGHGDSDATFSEYGDAPTADDIVALLRKLGPAVIVGNSMAAGAAVLVAADHPELVRGLVLVGPFVREPASDNVFSRLFFRMLMAPPWAAAVWRAYLPKLYAGTLPTDFAAYRDEVVRSIRRPGYARAFSRTTRTGHAQSAASLDRVHTPTLVVMGANDPDFKDPRAEAEWIASTLSGRAVLIADAGHYPQSQQPDHVASAVMAFLAEGTDRG